MSEDKEDSHSPIHLSISIITILVVINAVQNYPVTLQITLYLISFYFLLACGTAQTISLQLHLHLLGINLFPVLLLLRATTTLCAIAIATILIFIFIFLFLRVAFQSIQN